ncbi:MAG: nitroreductase family deazaflavin-dependent oxidoreductase [Actinomycetota bacterium]|nr:nitroreductase family deazaflavin-dependent oxidoreductase [Actinomycetota bacterium]MDQ3681258.1 nitroreductase family deazaflavin-dependent oxidoreductase [Actinomycetota bacterium]
MTSAEPPQGPGDEDYCYLTTTGRVTGRPHRIEIWFALEGSAVYLLAGGGTRADWVSNLIAAPPVTLQLAGRRYSARARVVHDEDEERAARRLLYDKYRRGYQGSLERWRDEALPVAVELHERP